MTIELNRFTWRRVALILATLLLAVAFLYYGLYGTVRIAGDFANYYTAARLALDHKLNDPSWYEFYRFTQAIQVYFPNVLGGLIPHPPATVLSVMPLAMLEPFTAKIVFNLLNVALLCLVILLLSRITRLDWLLVTFLVLLDGANLWSNFIQGQHYVLLLFTIVCGLWLTLNGRHFWAGVMFGLFIPIKYFAIVYVLYFLVRRNFRLVLGAAVSILVVSLLGLYFTSLEFNFAFFTDILPQHLAGRIQDPFTVSFQSYASLLNRLFVFEPSLNPTPAFDSLPLRDVLKTLSALTLLILTVFGIWTFSASESTSYPDSARAQTLFSVSLLTLFGLVNSPAMASYHFVLMILPMVLLTGLQVERSGRLPGELPITLIVLITLYALLNFFPLHTLYRFDGKGWLTPLAYGRLFLLTAFFLLSLPRRAYNVRTLGAIGVAALVSAGLTLARPAPPSDGAKWAGYDGLILHNLSEQDGKLFYARNVTNGFTNFVNGEPVTANEPLPPKRTLTRDRRYSLFDAPVQSGLSSHRQIFVRDMQTQAITQLTFADAKNIEPVWAEDDRHVHFLSDRGRGVDCATIYTIEFVPPQ